MATLDWDKWRYSWKSHTRGCHLWSQTPRSTGHLDTWLKNLWLISPSLASVFSVDTTYINSNDTWYWIQFVDWLITPGCRVCCLWWALESPAFFCYRILAPHFFLLLLVKLKVGCGIITVMEMASICQVKRWVKNSGVQWCQGFQKPLTPLLRFNLRQTAHCLPKAVFSISIAAFKSP